MPTYDTRDIPERNPAAQKKTPKIVSGAPSAKKADAFTRLFAFFVGDTPEAFAQDFVQNTAMPRIREILADTAMRIIYRGEAPARTSRAYSTSASASVYHNAYNNTRRNAPAKNPPRNNIYAVTRENFVVDFYDYEDANNVLQYIFDTIDKGMVVPLGDIKDMIGISREDAQLEINYGWKTIPTNTTIRSENGKFTLTLPPVTYIK